MQNQPLKEDLELHEAFEIIMQLDDIPEYIKEISELIFIEGLNQKFLKEILAKYHINRVEDIKHDTLNLVIEYINIILNDHEITQKEQLNTSLLKRFFKIKEGDFYTLRYFEIKKIIHKQIEIIHRDNQISYEKALHKVEIQDLFDLSYDQFMEIKKLLCQKKL